MGRVRLSDYEILAIKETAKEVFGERTKVFLFGSRVDPTKRGGDIDLYIIPEERNNLLDRELRFKSKLQLKIGERKIDVILSQDPKRDIEKVALETGVEL
jgi:predicted nucleotidyltransferase